MVKTTERYVLEEVLDALKQIEDPNGCMIQEIRLRAAEEVDHHSKNIRVQSALRDEFVRSFKK